MLALLKSRFEQEGFEVVSITAGEALQQPFTDTHPDLIVVGKSLTESEFGGLAHLGTRSVPVILLTGGEPPSGTSGDAPSEIAQLKLPFRPSQLVELARKTIASA
ncbi:hypothetical protein BH24DEI2_BH24DEI2_18310 [soil metagenome]